MAKSVMRARRGLSRFTVDALQGELTRRERTIVRLQRRYHRLLAAAGKVERQIQAEGGTARGAGGRARGGAVSGRRRARNELSLVEALAKVLKGRTMGVTEVSHAVQRAGYKTASPNFRTIVNQALIKSAAFKKVSRGKYTAK